MGPSDDERGHLDRARAGDQRAFGELTDPLRRELQLHCYRMLGSVQDAEDALQETLVAARRGLATFEGRASMSWLYRIATNRCLNTLRDAGRRPPAAPVAPFRPPEPTRQGEPTWLQPYPDQLLEGIADPRPGPRPATRPGRRSSWRSWPGCWGCRRASGRRWCSATCSASRSRRRRACSGPAARRSRAPCSAPGRPWRSAGPPRPAGAPRGRARPPSGSSPGASPTPSRPTTSTGWSGC